MSEHGSEHHAGHVHLEYQPALPLRNGKLCLWLFLSTEIMFFAGLIGTYIVLRFGAPAWPSPHDVHLIEIWGAVNTFFLICSSVTVVLSLEAAHANRASSAKFWLMLTFVLGTIFLLIKMYEYNSKFAHGIYPAKPRSLLWERADLYYLSAVRESLQDERLSIEARRDENQQLAAADQEKLDTVDTILQGLVLPAERKAAATDQVGPRFEAVQLVASAIYPRHGQREALLEQLEQLEPEIKSTDQRLTQQREQLVATQSSLQAAPEAERDAGKLAEVGGR